MSRDLLMYTIYQGLTDRPGPFVVRQWLVTNCPVPLATGIVFDAPDLEAARKHIPLGLTRLPPDQCDDPTIVETWF